jgi:hypothetical protein
MISLHIIILLYRDVGLKFRPRYYSKDGINTINYNLTVVELRPLYTWMNVSLFTPRTIGSDKLSFFSDFKRLEPRKKPPKSTSKSDSNSTATMFVDFCDSH